MALGKIDHISMGCDDAEKTEKYFVEKLGFKLLRHTEHGAKAFELQSPAGDFFFDFHERSKDTVPPGFGHIAFKVDDINKECEELKSKGLPIQGPGFTATTGRTLANVPDADGRFWIQLSER